MFNFLKRNRILIVLILYFLINPLNLLHASIIFSDSFSGGYSESWQVTPGSSAPAPSPNGITGINNSSWADIIYPLNQRIFYDVKFDLYINDDTPSNVWRLYLIDSSFANYKIINNWGSDNLLQISDNIEANSLVPWDHSVGVHNFQIIFSPDSNTDITVIQNGIQRAKIRSSSDFDPAYINIGLLGQDYELANFVLSTTISDVTPTPSPDPTPLPSPTLPPNRKIIVIPGMGGSWNLNALINCTPGDGTEGWTQRGNDFDLLIQNLQNNNFDVYPFYYDWRRIPQQTAQLLAQKIQNITEPGETIDIIAHSFGGLVTRAYIEQEQNNSRLNSVITAGTPYAGGIGGYLAWEGGDLESISDINQRILLTAEINFCSQLGLPKTALSALHQYVPSGQYILPTFNFLYDQKTGNSKPPASMFYTNPWLGINFSLPFYGIQMATLTGINQQTLSSLNVKEPSTAEKLLGYWRDGKPTAKTKNNSGDGLVLQSSAQLPGADNSRVEALDHGQLINSQKGINRILDFLGVIVPPTSAIAPPIVKSPTSAVAFISSQGSIEASTPDGKHFNDSNGLLIIPNPTSGKYKLSITLGYSNTNFFILQVPENGKSLWKKYNFGDSKIKLNKEFNFDAQNPKQDSLE